MKKIIIPILILFPVICLGQSSFNKQAISNAGEKSTFSGGSFTWTIGETAVGTISGTNVALLQGFAPTNLTVATPPTPPAVSTITQPTCALATGSVVLTGLPSSGIWTLTRSPGGNTSTGTGTNATITGLAAGTYTYIVTDANSLTSSPSSNIVINAQPVTPLAPVLGTITQPTCALATGSVVLSGLPSSGTWTLTKSPGGSTSTGSGASTTITGLTAGTYNYTVTNSLGCTSVSASGIVINIQPSTPAVPSVGSITQPTCAVPGGSVALSGLPSSGSWTITRSPGEITTSGSGSTATINGIPAGSYTFIVTNASGCSSGSSSNAVLNTPAGAPSAPQTSTITHPDCITSTGSVILTGLPSSGTWTIRIINDGTTINGSGTTASISGLIPETYTFSVTNSSNCISAPSSSVVINNPPEAPASPAIVTITQPTCSVTTGNVALSGLPSAGSWTLTRTPGNITTAGTGSTVTVTGIPSGTYTFIITNSAGCTSTASGNFVIDPQVIVPEAPIVGSVSNPSCIQATGSAELMGLPSAGTWTLTSYPGASTWSGTGTTTNITGLTAGTYTFTVTNDLGCTSPISGNLIINAQPVTPSIPVIGTIVHPTCLASTGFINLSGLPTSGNWTVTRNPGAIGTNGSGSSTTISGIPSGTFTFIVTNSFGCSSGSSSPAVINPQPPLPSAPLTGSVVQPTCLDNTGSVIVSGLPAGTWTLSSIPGGNLTGSSGSVKIFDLSPGSYTFRVTTSEGCVSPNSGNIDINQPDPGSIPRILSKWNGGVLVCNNYGDSLRRYQWYKDGSKLSNDTLQYIVIQNNPGIYTVQSTDKDGCKNFSAPVLTTSLKSLTTYPNPATENFNLVFNGYSQSKVVMSFYNSLGIKLFEIKGENMQDPVFKNIDISHFEKGTYIIKVVFEKSEQYFSKIVKID